MEFEINTPELLDNRKAIIEMLYAEGNHFCPSCEKSGKCDMQNLDTIWASRSPAIRTSSATRSSISIRNG
ncbi:MAG: hypothetical protein IPJ30_19355 [Acidobacteria bacterium]|nr:hypothetical protein [Acidobacteriota bacterium]